VAGLLEIDGLSVWLTAASGRSSILDDVSFSLQPGEVLGVVGESGSGKSVLALSIMGLLPAALTARARSLRLLGDELSTRPREAFRAHRGRDVAMIFQEPMTSLNPVMRVGTQIAEVLTWRRGMSQAAANRRTIELLEQVEMPQAASCFGTYPHELSGGMRQRVMIAIALAANPKLLIADEPTTALDVTVQAQILRLLTHLQRSTGLSLILITHDIGVIAELAERVMVGTIFDAPAHPYTQALLASVPDIRQQRGRLATIAGTVPDALSMPSGCRFAPRCPHRRDVCAATPPALTVLAAGHEVGCLRPFGYLAGRVA